MHANAFTDFFKPVRLLSSSPLLYSGQKIEKEYGICGIDLEVKKRRNEPNGEDFRSLSLANIRFYNVSVPVLVILMYVFSSPSRSS